MRPHLLRFLPLIGLVAGCAAYQIAGDVETGRIQLITGKPEAALPYFQSAADKDPNYIKSNGLLQEGVWTYVGRTLYTLGKYPDARQALERAVAQDPNDYLAKIYLGLTEVQAGDRQRGVSQLDAGLKDLYDWLEYIPQYLTYGTFWDPSRAIRSEIEATRAMIAGKDIDWPTLIASGEWIGKKTEEEADWAKRDERMYYNGGGPRFND